MQLWRSRTPKISCCKLENQESQWCSSVWVQRSQEPEAVMSKSRRRWMSQLKLKVNSPFLVFCLGPQWTEWCPSTLGKAIYFTCFANSNANLFRQQLHRHIQKYVLSIIWTFLSSDKLTQTFKHHSSLSITYKQALGESSDCWMLLYDCIQNKTIEYDSAYFLSQLKLINCFFILASNTDNIRVFPEAMWSNDWGSSKDHLTLVGWANFSFFTRITCIFQCIVLKDGCH